MPLYFFQLTGPSTSAGPTGFELVDDEAAWSLAVTSTGELLRDLDGKMPDHSEFVATVTDESGRIVLTLRVTGEKGSQG